jgi:hypothetical protein
MPHIEFPKKTLQLITSLLIILSLITFLSLGIVKVEAQTTGWLSGWMYRRAVTINNTQNSNTLSDYQVLVIVDTASLISAGKLQGTCADIRFTDSDGQTLLNYWIESGCNTASTRIWVRVSSIPGASTKTIYLYYGNPSASSASNPVNTFWFFDDFTTYRSTNGTWSNLVTESFGGKYVMSVVAGNAEIVLTLTSSVSNIGIEFRYYIVSVGSYGPRANINFKESGTSRAYMLINEIGSFYSNHYWIGYYDGSTSTKLTYDGNTYSTGVWYRNYFYRSSTTGKLVGQLGASTVMTTTHTTLTSFNRIGFGTWDTGNKYYIDWVAVRNYADPEPTATVSTTEENAIPLPPTLQSPSSGFRFNPQASVNFTWTYNPKYSNDYQVAFQLQISNATDFSILFYDTGQVSSTNTYVVITLPSNMTVGVYYWRIKVWSSLQQTIPSDWSSAFTLYVDTIVVTLSVNDSRTDVGSYVNVSWVLKFKSDGSSITNYSITIARDGVGWYSGSASYSLDTSSDVSAHTYNATYVKDNVYGVTVFETNSITVVWDKVVINSITPTRPRFTVGDTASFNITAVYAYDNTSFNGSFTFNDTLVKSVVGLYTYSVTSITDNLYGLTRFEGNTTVSVIFDKLVIDSWFVNAVNKSGSEVLINNNSRVDYTSTVKPYVKLKHAYDGLEVTSGTVSLFNTPATYVNGYWVAIVNTTAVDTKTYPVLTSAQSDVTTVRFVDIPPNFTVMWDALNVTLVSYDVISEVGTVKLIYASDGAVANGVVGFVGANTTTVNTVNGLANLSIWLLDANVTSPHTAYGVVDVNGLVWTPYQNASVPIYKLVFDRIRVKADNPITILSYTNISGQFIHVKYDVKGSTAVNLTATAVLVNGRPYPITLRDGHTVLYGLSSTVDIYSTQPASIIMTSYASAPGFDVEVGLTDNSIITSALLKAGVLMNSTAFKSTVFVWYNGSVVSSKDMVFPSPPTDVLVSYYCESNTTLVVYVGLVYMSGNYTRMDTVYVKGSVPACPASLYPYVYAPTTSVFVERYGSTLGMLFRLLVVGDLKVSIVGPVIPGSLLKYVYVSSPLAIEYVLTDINVYPYGAKGVTLKGFRGWSLSYSVSGVTISGVSITSDDYVVDVPVGITLVVSVDPVGRSVSIVSASPPPVVTSVPAPTVTPTINLPDVSVLKPSIPQTSSLLMYGVFLALAVTIYSVTRSLSTAIVVSGVVSSVYAFATKDLSILPYTAVAITLGIALYVASRE